MLADLEQDAERLATLADDLLALSREEAAGTPQEIVSLDELALEAAGGRVDAVASGPVRVRGDRAALERALANLVQNALRHGPEGGRITVSAEQIDGVARLTVADEGEGLRLEETELAFQRFWRGGRAVGGSGLGLAIVRATAERHGGRAYVRGSRFTIELPALRDLSGSAVRTSGDEPEKGFP